MYKNVLIPVDLAHPEQASAMIQTARSIADPSAKLTLMYVLAEIPGVVSVQLPEGMYDKARADVEGQLKQLARDNGVEDISRIQTITGHPYQQILEVAEKSKIDLIVIASHQPGLADYLLGSVAARVVRHAKCSVHVMR